MYNKEFRDQIEIFVELGGLFKDIRHETWNPHDQPLTSYTGYKSKSHNIETHSSFSD